MTTVDVTAKPVVPSHHSPLRLERETLRINVAIIADDPVTAVGARVELGRIPSVNCATGDDVLDADVVMVFTTALTDPILTQMETTKAGARNPRQCLVLVSDEPKEAALARAIRAGLVSFIPRKEANSEVMARTLIASTQGRSSIPDGMVRWLVDQNRRLEQHVLASRGLTPGGLTVREAEVVRLLADGLTTRQIAEELRFAERTVKRAIHDLLTRLDLSNRSQAVAYAIRTGAI